MYLGTSNQMQIGPFALVSMMVSSICSVIVSPDLVSDYVDCVMNLSFLLGVILLIWGICHLGVVTALLSDPILNAFTTASAFNISASQFKYLFGMSLKRVPFFPSLYYLFKNIPKTNWWAFLISMLSLAFIIATKRLNKRFCGKIPIPSELIVVIIVTVLSAIFNFEEIWNIDILHDIPSGLPKLSFPTLKYTSELIIPSLTLALIAYAVGISIGKTFGKQYGYRIDPNQELLSQGIANIVGSMTAAYPSAGSLSRSAVVASIGGVTPLHNLFEAGIVSLALLFFTNLLYSLPQAVLGAIVVSSFEKLILQLFDVRFLYKQTVIEFFEYMICFVLTCAFDTQVGLYSGLGLSLVVLICQLIYYCGIKNLWNEIKNMTKITVDYTVVEGIIIKYI